MLCNSNENVRLLHICVAGIKDKFYQIFFDKLFEVGIKYQTVFIPYCPTEYTQEEIEGVSNYSDYIDVKLSPIKTQLDRLFYFSKIKKYCNHVRRIHAKNQYNLIHAHHLFSDGGVAYLLHKQYDIPYIVSVRTTDTEYFMKYFIHTKNFMNRILDSASKVICINPIIKEKLLQGIKDKTIRGKVTEKVIVMPNGVDDFWIENLYLKKSNSLPTIRLVQVGSLIPRKNHKCTLLAIENLKNRGYDVRLDIVGDGKGRKTLELLCKEKNLEKYVKFHGFIKDRQKILSFYRSADVFVLPSFTETFGIAYVEAMTQGLPVIYSRRQGIDGFYSNGEVGIAIDPRNPVSVADAILLVTSYLSDMSKRCTDYSIHYKWDNIVTDYKYIYLEAKKSKHRPVY